LSHEEKDKFPTALWSPPRARESSIVDLILGFAEVEARGGCSARIVDPLEDRLSRDEIGDMGEEGSVASINIFVDQILVDLSSTSVWKSHRRGIRAYMRTREPSRSQKKR
jgi:hypothetical protein